MLQHFAAVCSFSSLIIRWKTIESSLMSIPVHASINIKAVYVAEHNLPFS